MLEMKQSIGARDAIITAFWDVFSRDVSLEAEISEVLAMARVSEFAYERFQSKEDLASAFLKDRHAVWMRWFEHEIDVRHEATGGGLEIIADALQEGCEVLWPCLYERRYRGRQFDNEPFAIAKEQRKHLRRFIKQLAARMGLQHPDIAACATVRVIERAIVRTLRTGSLKEAQTARLLLQCLQHA